MADFPTMGGKATSRHPRGMKRRLAALLATPLILALAACAPASAPSSRPAGGHTVETSSYSLTYVAIGASDSFGIGTDDPDRQSWPTDLANLLGGDVHLINLGIPGATVAEAQRAELPIALASHPDVVTVWMAVNDLADGVPLATYQQQLAELVGSLVQSTQARVYVANVPDLTQLPYFAQQDQIALAARIHQWNSAIAGVCAAQGATLVDLYAGWRELASHPEYIAADGLHPSAIGAERLAQVFAAVIQRPSSR